MPVPSQALRDSLHAGAEVARRILAARKQGDGDLRHRRIEALPVSHVVDVGETLQEARAHLGTEIIELIFAVVGNHVPVTSHPAGGAVAFAQAVSTSVKHLGDEGLGGGTGRVGRHGLRERLVVKGGLEAA